MSSPSKAHDETAVALGRLAREASGGTVDDAAHQRGKERLVAALAAPPRRRLPRAAQILAAAAVLGLVAVLVLVALPRSDLTFAVTGVVVGEGGYVRAPPEATAVVRFSEGTEVSLAPGARARVSDVTGTGACLVLESGEASLLVRHLPGARWSVEAGPFVVEVTGTAFDIRWSVADEALEVHLREGSVIVRGPLAQDGIALRAGETLRARPSAGELRIEDARRSAVREVPTPPAPRGVPTPPISPAPSTTAAPASAPATGGSTASTSAASSPQQSVAPAWPALVRAGDYRGVLSDADARGGADAVIASAPLHDLVALADAARYLGRADVARRALEGQRARFGGSAEARAAAFLLGRLAEDAQGSPGAAIGWYDRYLAEAPSGTFAAEALGRKMLAVKRSSGSEAARATAVEYLQRFPGGAHAAVARELAPPREPRPPRRRGGPAERSGR